MVNIQIIPLNTIIKYTEYQRQLLLFVTVEIGGALENVRRFRYF